MKVYTGNFGNVKKYRDAGIHCVSIALSAKYYTGDAYKWLTPEWSFMQLSTEDYIKAFNKKISKYSAEKVFNSLACLSKGNDVVLLCHEKEGDFCHRRLVADWMSEKLKIEVLELGRMDKPVKKVETQQTLF